MGTRSNGALKYQKPHVANTSVRERFGIEPQNIAAASRPIKEAVEAKSILPYDMSTAPKLMKLDAFHRWMNNKSEITAIIEKMNGRPDRPSIMIYVAVVPAKQ